MLLISPSDFLKLMSVVKMFILLAKKLIYHQSNHNNRRKKTNEVISVEVLLNVCPEIPAIEEVRLKKRWLEFKN